jgi:transposase
MRTFVGLDISLQKTAVCVENDDGTIAWQSKVDSEPGALVAALMTWKDSIGLVGMEACPLSEWIYAGLVAAGFNVRCIETRHAQRFLSTRPNKTDKNDARGIADMMRLGHFKPVHVKSVAALHMKTLIVARKQMLSAILKLEGTIRGLLRVHGLKVGVVHRCRFRQRIEELLETAPQLSLAIEPLLDASDAMRKRYRKFDNHLGSMARRDQTCLRLMTVPGVGPITALAFVATIDDPRRFVSSKTVGAHLGLTPRIYQSGEFDHAGHISKCGDRLMRYYLYEAATTFLLRSKHWSSLRAWGVRLAKRQGWKRARVAVARKLAIVMHRMWLSGESFRFSKAPEVAPAT